LIQLRNAHIALRIGEYVPLETGNNAVLAFLRVQAGEVVLVVINLGNKPVSGLSLLLAQGTLSGKYTGYLLLGTGEPGVLEANAQGGFTTYQPAPELPASSSLIIQLLK
jgi:glycosidase